MKKSLAFLSLLMGSSLAAGQTAPVTPVPVQSGAGVSIQAAPQLQMTRTLTITRPERPMIWAGLASEYILPAASFGVSVPIRATPDMNMALRGSAEAVVIPFAEYASPVPLILNADLLFSSPAEGVKVYGGPNIGTLLGYAWAVGGILGVRNEFGKLNLGWYAEGKGQVLFGSGATIMIPGLRFGLTYRF